MSRASVETFLLQINSGKTKTDKAKIYKYIRRNERTHKEAIMRDLNMSHQTVTARLSGLLDMGVIEVVEVAENALSNSRISRFKVQYDPAQIQKNKINRDVVKFNKWKAKAKEYKSFLSSEVITELSA